MYTLANKNEHFSILKILMSLPLEWIHPSKLHGTAKLSFVWQVNNALLNQKTMEGRSFLTCTLFPPSTSPFYLSLSWSSVKHRSLKKLESSISASTTLFSNKSINVTGINFCMNT